MSLPDLTPYVPYFILAGAGAGAASAYAVLRRKKPKLHVKCKEKKWYKRQTTVVTSIDLLLSFSNKGSEATTVEQCTLEIVYHGNSYGPYPSETLNIGMTVGHTTDKRVIFQVPIADVVIDSTIEKAIVVTKHTFKTSKITITNIKQGQ